MDENIVELVVNSLSDKGEGIAFYNDNLVFIQNTLVGERVKVRLGDCFAIGSKRRPGYLIEILEKSPDRALDSQATLLGGTCVYGNLKYKTTLKIKQELIFKALKEIGCTVSVPEVEASNIKYPCRNKSIRFFGKKDNVLIQGYYKPRTHYVEECTQCILEPKWFSIFAQDLCCVLGDFSLEPYDEIRKVGCLRSLMMRDCGKEERLCVLVVAEPLSFEVESAFSQLAEDYNVKACFICFNNQEGNAIIRGEIKSLGENDFIKTNYFGYDFSVGPLTFLQVNYEIARNIYDKAIAFCKTSPIKGDALDLCSGIGTMTLGLSKYFAHVTGIEIVEQSVEAARKNAKQNHVDNVSFVAGDLKEKLSLYVNKNISALIADPSRVGLGDEVCEEFLKLKKGAHLSLIFCELKALKRDCRKLLSLGFKIKEVRGFDMFPFTNHVETLVLMERV